MSNRALIVIDIQNDYFADGQFPLCNTEPVLNKIEDAITKAHQANIPVILVQHIADTSRGISPFFNAGTPGVEIHPRILAAAPEANIVIKTTADSFHQTNLEQTLSALGIDEIWICGMMTQNCVTHTAISKAAEKYAVKVLSECCASVSEMIHRIALSALGIRVELMAAPSY